MFRLPAANLKSSVRWIFVAAGFAGAMAAMAAAAEIPMAVQLNNPLSMASAHKGDPITAYVASPDSLKGDTIQGKVTQVNSSRGQAVLEFTFNVLHHGHTDVAITANIQSVWNSNGQQAVDEKGQSLRASNTPGTPPSQSKVSRLGGLIGSRTGVSVPDAPATAGSPPAIQVAAQGSSLELGAGATLMLSAQSTSGPDLADLSPNVPARPAAASNPPAASAATPQAGASSPPAAADGAGGQPELKSTKIDFIPGERTVFYDDFSDAAEDEPPPHWKVRGDPVELRVGGGIRQLTNIGHSNFTSAPIAFPTSFTLELDIKFPIKAESWAGATWDLETKEGRGAARLALTAHVAENVLNFNADDSKDRLGGKDVPNIDFNQPVHVALWSQNGRFRVYVNGERVLDVNATTVPTPNEIYAEFNPGAPATEVGIRRVRVAESAPDFAAVIGATGKYVTHGINFDTDSDRLKPESAPVLKQVVAGLEKNPNLKLEIDGYTDSVGDAAHNLDLSKRRAEAVRSVLVSQFGVDAARLTSNGFGAAQPIGSNDTPEGRAGNRRVEFLKK
jgi:outer membrane protein OmpA-like peptidoglycan-associated protein